MTSPAPEKLLIDDHLYLSYDRIICGRLQCAGATAAYTGVTLGGARVIAVRVEDVARWESMGMGQMVCECGSVTAEMVEGRMKVSAA